MRLFVTILFALPLFLSAQEQFKSSNQRDWEFYKEHPEEVGKNIVQPKFAKRSDLMKTQSMNKVVYGFHPYWQNGSESNYYFSLLTHLVYFSADIDAATGGFTTTNSWASASVVTTAKQYGLKVHLCLVLFADHSTLLTNTTAKNALIANTLAQLVVRNADGVNIDFESMASSNRDNFRIFMKQFGDSLKAHGKEFVIELPAVDWSSVSDGVGLFDATFFSAVNPVVDFYFCMLYDYWWSGSATAGPNSPLLTTTSTSYYHVLRSINKYLTTGCPANKFIAGFPNYGREWAVKSTVANADTLGGYASASRTYTVVKNNYIDTIPANRQFWSSTFNTRYYNYFSSGVLRQVWYDDSLSWARKFDSIKVKNVAGTGMWALGYDGSEPEMWGEIKRSFASTPNAAHTSFDNFEGSVGHFVNSPTFSGTTLGISTGSTASYTNDIANNGSGSIQLLLKDNTSSGSDWYVRFVSGGGNPASNVSFNTTGYLGYWMKTSSAKSGLQTAICVDDGAGGTLISSKQNIIADGAWHLYEWNLASTNWDVLASPDNILDGPTATIDAIMLYATNDASDWTIYVDDVSRNASGTLPVELVDFSGFNKELLVHVNWKTATEQDNYGFEIERKAVRVSGLEFPDLKGEQSSNPETQNTNQQWLRLGFVEGSGNSNSMRSYTFVDAVTKPGTYTYRLRQIDRNGAFRYSSEMNVTITGYPDSYSLEQNFPNPFNPNTVISYQLPMNSIVTLKIYDILGKEVETLVNGEQESGVYSLQWNAAGFASGVYFYTLKTHQTNGGQAGDFSATKKLLLMK